MNRGITCLLLALLFLSANAIAQEQGGKKATVYFFYSETCPHCTKEVPFLKEMEGKYENLEVKYLLDVENAELFKQMCEGCGSIPAGVPRTFVGETF